MRNKGYISCCALMLEVDHTPPKRYRQNASFIRIDVLYPNCWRNRWPLSMLDYEKAISIAEQKCLQGGVRFTQRRKQVLSVLIRADAALSAYEIAEQCNADSDTKMPAMSVYRILDLLQEQNLIHRLEIANKYVSCSHISCSHEHNKSQFLICGGCR